MKRTENNRNVAKVTKRIIKETVQNKSVIFFLRLSFSVPVFSSLFLIWIKVQDGWLRCLRNHFYVFESFYRILFESARTPLNEQCFMQS